MLVFTKGFALPTILIASIVMLTVLLTAVGATIATRNSLNDQYYNRLAKEAADSGMAKATACIVANNHLMPWQNEGGTLKPGTDCSGYDDPTLQKYVSQKDNLTTTFELTESTVEGAYYAIESTGSVLLSRTSNGDIWKTYKQSVRLKLNYVGAYATTSASGYAQTCGIINGESWCWGSGNSFGKLGNGTTDDAIVPSQVVRETGVLAGKTDTDIAVGNAFACSVSDGSVYCWGRNNYGQLGNDAINTTANPSPVLVKKESGFLSGRTIKQVATGGRHACALATDGNVFCWGRNDYGQLGNNSTTDSAKPVSAMVGALSGKTVTKIAAVPDVDATCAIASGELYCWGRNSSGELGIGSATPNITVPQKVAGLLAGKSVTDIAISSEGSADSGSGIDAHACAVANSTVYCWGNNSRGRLGDNTTTDSNSPVAVYQASPGLLGKTVTRVVTGHPHSCALTSDNQVYCWGNNGSGQLGVNTSSVSYSTVPLAVYRDATNGIEGRTITDITGGGNRSCVIASGTNFCWGLNAAYQIGDGTTINRFRPTVASYLEQWKEPYVY